MSPRRLVACLAPVGVSAVLFSLLVPGRVAPASASVRPAPPLARPSPQLVNIQLHYSEPLLLPGGAVATFAPLSRAAVAAALADTTFLRYHFRTDLGGFEPAPVGGNPLTTGAHQLVGAPLPPHQIPTYAHAGSGRVTIFAAVGGFVSSAPPDNGVGPVAGLGIPPPSLPQIPGPIPSPFSPSTTLPSTSLPSTTSGSTTSPPPSTALPQPQPQPRPRPRPIPTTTTEPKAHPTTTTTPRPTTTTSPPTTSTSSPDATTTTTSPPATTTTVGPTTTTAPPRATTTTTTPPVPIGSNCSNVVDIVETGDHPSCRLVATGMVPGQLAAEELTITNKSTAPFELSLQVHGTPSNALWNAVQLWVTNASTGSQLAPAQTLDAWLAAPEQLAKLGAGASIHLEVALELPLSAGNPYQRLAAPFDLVWHAQG